jgi:hypothetical protein
MRFDGQQPYRKHSTSSKLASTVVIAKRTLLQHLACRCAGALQMVFLLYTCEASTPIDAIHRMSLSQFKAMLHAAKVTSSSLPPEKLDEVFTAVQASKGAASR